MDYALEQLINGSAGTTHVIDEVMKILAVGAEVIFLVLVGVWFICGWWGRSRMDRLGAVAATVAAAGALGVNQVIGHLWDRPRPFVSHPCVHVLLSRSNDPSFPSDHAAAAFAIAIVLLLTHRRSGIAALCLATLVAYARVYVGAHYPGDVAAGAVVGAIVAVTVLHRLGVVPDRLTAVGDAVLRRLGLLPARL